MRVGRVSNIKLEKCVPDGRTHPHRFALQATKNLFELRSSTMKNTAIYGLFQLCCGPWRLLLYIHHFHIPRLQVDGSRLPFPLNLQIGILFGQRPKGIDDLCFQTNGKFYPSSPSYCPPSAPTSLESNSNFEAKIPAARPESQPPCPNPILKAKISCLRPKSHP